MSRFCASALRWLLASTAIGAALFILTHIAEISGAIAPPAGYIPQYVLRNADMAFYLNWMEAGRQSWLVPNFGAPWLTTNELFTPILTLMGHLSNALPWSTLADYYVMHFMLTILSAGLLIAVLRHFLPSRNQRIAGIAAIFCSVPYLSIGYAIAKAAGFKAGILALGLVEYTYITADGLVRGGASNSVTLTFGTTTILAAVLLLAKRIESGSVRWLWGLAAVNFASAFFHPFEFLVITGSSCCILALEAYRRHNWPRAIRHSALLAVSGALGVCPYLIQLYRVQWLRDMPALDPGTPLNIASVLVIWGLPAFLTIYALLLGFRPRTPRDEIPAVFCLVALLLLFVFKTFTFHLLDGFTYLNAIWLIRVAATDEKARAVLQRNKRPLAAFCSVWLVLCACAHIATTAQLVRDGRAADPDVLISTVAPASEPVIRDWLRARAASDDLILAPGLMSAWIARTPIHSFASQENWLGMGYEQQFKDASSFYAAKWSPEAAHDFLRKSGIRWVLVPAKSPSARYFQQHTPEASFGDLSLYLLPENHTRRYPDSSRALISSNF